MFPSILTFNFDPIYRFFFGFLGPKGYFWVWDFVTICFAATHIVQQLLFSCFPSILTFDFVLILGLFWIFGTQMVYFFWLWWFSKLFWGSLIKLQFFLFSLLPSIVTFVFDLNLGYFGLFWGPNGLFLAVRVRFKNCFGVCSYCWTTFIFYVSFNSDFLFWLKFGVLFDFLGH